MKLADWLKVIFPKPRLPQKRYVMIACLVAYPLLQMYVDHTKAEWDNQLLDATKGVVLEYFADNEDAPSSQYDDHGMRYGERD